MGTKVHGFLVVKQFLGCAKAARQSNDDIIVICIQVAPFVPGQPPASDQPLHWAISGQI